MGSASSPAGCDVEGMHAITVGGVDCEEDANLHVHDAEHIDIEDVQLSPASQPRLQLVRYCSPILDHDGLCHFTSKSQVPHSPYLKILQSKLY